MKYLTILFLFYLMITIEAISKEGAVEIFMKAEAGCRTKIGATQDHFNKLAAQEVLSDPVGKCYGTCILEDIGMIKDNKMVEEMFMAGAEMMYGEDATTKAKAYEVIKECLPMTDADKCEAGFKIASCMKAGREARGFKMVW